ncbi:MAG: endopeptidase La, partial [Candidatus Aminicenantes bacterium]|nr:endopeptidase La [Candidatus Aminicenantes bacterium]
AIPKDGPSAGITLATALCSAFTGKPINRKLSMTGEITLRGKVLPVGGIKEKILAAKRSGIKNIIIPENNKKDLQELQKKYLDGIKFIFVKDIKEVVDAAMVEKIL